MGIANSALLISCVSFCPATGAMGLLSVGAAGGCRPATGAVRLLSVGAA